MCRGRRKLNVLYCDGKLPRFGVQILRCGKLGLCSQPGPDSVKDKPLAGTRQPYHEKPTIPADGTHGSGANNVAKPATNAVAPTVPKESYIFDVNNGKAAPKQLLTKLLLASTEAAIGR